MLQYIYCIRQFIFCMDMKGFKMKKYGFTLAEVLITLAIIGIVAALTIPSFLSIYEQHAFKTGLSKALNTLNNSIATSIALDEESPLTNTDTFNYLQRHMTIIKSTWTLPWTDTLKHNNNAAFYTPDGMRFEFWGTNGVKWNNFVGFRKLSLHESTAKACNAALSAAVCGGCGSYGLASNPQNTSKPPCFILVDVNGDKKPNPTKTEGSVTYQMKPTGFLSNANMMSDIFLILITENKAIPFGVVAQRAMYSK